MSKINGKKVSKKNQLYDIAEYNVENIVFADPELGTVPNSDPPVGFYRVDLLTQNAKLDDENNFVLDKEGNQIKEDTLGDVNFLLDKMFCFGVSEQLSTETKALVGHSMSFAMWSKEGVTERELKTTNTIEAFVKRCKEHLISIRKDLKKPKLEMSDLKAMDKLLWWKEDEEGNRVPGIGPSFSPKLVEYKEKKEKDKVVRPHTMGTIFYLAEEVDENGDPVEVNPLDYLTTKTNKCYMYGRPVVKFESIFFGGKNILIQCKVTECDIYPLQKGTQRLLHGKHKVNVNKTLNLTPSQSNPLCAKESPPSPKQPSPKDKKKEELSDDPPSPKPEEKKEGSDKSSEKKKLVKKKKTEE